MEFYGLTDIGTVRTKNQDNIVCLENNCHDFIGVVCDGVGSCEFSEDASAMITSKIKESFSSNEKSLKTQDEVIAYIDDLLFRCNVKLFNKASTDSKYTYLSTTVAGLFINSENKIIFSAGDSRVYGVKGGNLYQLSNDDTLVAKLISQGKLTPEQAKTYPRRNVITNACGIGSQFMVNYKIVKNKYDYYIICSDGFYKFIEDSEISKVLRKRISIKEKVNSLLAISLKNGGNDNISIIIVKE